MIKRILIAMGILLIIGLSLFGQRIRVSGTVIDGTDGTVLPGTTVVLAGTTIGTVTNIDGHYEITAATDATLIFSFIGMRTQEVPVDGRNVINVTLKAEKTGLAKVIISYGIVNILLLFFLSNISSFMIAHGLINNIQRKVRFKLFFSMSFLIFLQLVVFIMLGTTLIKYFGAIFVVLFLLPINALFGYALYFVIYYFDSKST